MTKPGLFRRELFLLIALLVAVAAYAGEHEILAAGRTLTLIAAFGIVATIVLASTRVAHHAEILAVKVGDPDGTMILTLSAVYFILFATFVTLTVIGL